MYHPALFALSTASAVAVPPSAPKHHTQFGISRAPVLICVHQSLPAAAWGVMVAVVCEALTSMLSHGTSIFLQAHVHGV